MGSRDLLLLALLLVSTTASCKSCDDPPPTKKILDASPPVASTVPPSATTSSVATPLFDASPPSEDDASATANVIEGDGGASLCRLAYGPTEQPFRGPATLVIHQQELRQIANDNGKPRIFPVAITPSPKGTPSVVPPRPNQFMGTRWPPCEVAGANSHFIYCQGPGSQVLRSTMNADGSTIASTKNIGKARSSTRLTAAGIGNGTDHSVVAFLDVRRTTEGDMLQAFVALDENPPVRLSEDGAGATTVRFLARGDNPVALYLDTRTAMVPIHARSMSLGKNGELALASDAVLFVGGAPERGIDFAVSLAGPSGKSYAFVPMPRDTMDFGMATLPIEDPPKDNIDAVWSKYPNGIDPAPIAAAPAKDGSGAWIARIRPRSKEVGSPRIIELGKVDAKTGAFTGLGEIASGKGVSDMAIIDDGTGVWVFYGDTTITWLERRICGK